MGIEPSSMFLYDRQPSALQLSYREILLFTFLQNELQGRIFFELSNFLIGIRGFYFLLFTVLYLVGESGATLDNFFKNDFEP